MFRIAKLSDHEYAQAYVRLYDDGTIELISYSTLVARISPAGWLEVTGLYSRTTIKHLGWFMKRYTSSTYYSAKKCVSDDMLFNVFTGEFKPSKEFSYDNDEYRELA